MDILILDIGCTNTKAYLYRGEQLIYDKKVLTAETAKFMVSAARNLVSDILREGYELQGIIVTSFSESVIVEDNVGQLELFGPYLETETEHKTDYLKTGYPSNPFPGVSWILKHLKEQKYPVFRALPVSTMIAAQLVHNRAWRIWDWTHASNSGLYGRGEWIWENTKEYGNWFERGLTVHPNSIVGYLNGITPVFVGGHDTVFSIYNRSTKAYVSSGTYITFSEPSRFTPREKEQNLRVRYIQDVEGYYHRQVCYKRIGSFTQSDGLLAMNMFGKDNKEIIVFGEQAQDVVDILRGYDFDVVLEGNNLQHEGALAVARTALS